MARLRELNKCPECEFSALKPNDLWMHTWTAHESGLDAATEPRALPDPSSESSAAGAPPLPEREHGRPRKRWLLVVVGIAVIVVLSLALVGALVTRKRAGIELTARQRAWCNSSMGEVYEQARSLGLAPVAQVSRAAALTPREELSTSYYSGLQSRTVYDVSADFLRENVRVGQWPHWTLSAFYGYQNQEEFRSYKRPLGAGPAFLWYSDRDFPRACNAAYEAEFGSRG